MIPPPAEATVIFAVQTPPGWFTIPLGDPDGRRRAVAALVRNRMAWRDDQPLLRERVEAAVHDAVGRADARDATHLCVWTANLGGAPIAASLVISVATGLDIVGTPLGVALILADRLAPTGAGAQIVELAAGPAVRRRLTLGGRAGPAGRRAAGSAPDRGCGGSGQTTFAGVTPVGANRGAAILRPGGPRAVEPVADPFAPDPLMDPDQFGYADPFIDSDLFAAPGPEPILGMTTLQYLVPVPNPAARALVALSFATPVAWLAEPLVELFDAIASSLRWEPR